MGSHQGVTNMDDGWAKPCSDSDAGFNGVHEWVTRRSRRRKSRIIPLGWDGLISAISRDLAFSWRETADALQSLLDLEWAEKVDEGFRVLVEKNLAELAAQPGAAGREGGSLVAKRLDADDAIFPLFGEASAASRIPGVMGKSAQFYGGTRTPRPSGLRVELCRDFFTNLVEAHRMETIPGHLYWRGLCSQVKKFQGDYQVDLTFVRQMMEEFVRHPEWCQRSRRPAWQVFISRREELLGLVKLRQRHHPGDRRYQVEGDQGWLTTGRERHTQGAEYWLGRS